MADDWGSAQIVDTPASTSAPAASGWGGAQIADQPSFLSRAANAVKWTADKFGSFANQNTDGKQQDGPIFTGEGPEHYQAAYAHNAPFAVPGPYDTKLSPQEEPAFQQWVKQNKVPFDLADKTPDYDMRGYWQAMKAGKAEPWKGEGSHFPDTYKTPYDTTFSGESRYAKPGTPFVWQGDNLVDQQTGKLIFGTPTKKEDPAGPVTDMFKALKPAPVSMDELDKQGQRAEDWYKGLGEIDVPSQGGKGVPVNTKVTAFDMKPATETAASLAMAPFAAEMAPGELAATAGIGTAEQMTNVGEKTQKMLETKFPSQSFHARLLKWLGTQGVEQAPFLMMPSFTARNALAGALGDTMEQADVSIGRDPANLLMPEQKVSSTTPTPEAPKEPVAAAEPSKLIPKPGKEPEMEGLPPKWDEAEIVEPEPKTDWQKERQTTPPALRTSDGQIHTGGEMHAHVFDKLTPEQQEDPGLETGFMSNGEFIPDKKGRSEEFKADMGVVPKEPPPVATSQAALSPLGKAKANLEELPTGDVRNVPIDRIKTDKDRFQYKLNTDEEGGGRALTTAEKFNPNLAGTTLGWRDPEDGQIYMVNGHQRLSLARRSDFPYLPMKILDGGNELPEAAAHNVSASDARSLGALINIGEGRGDAVDAASYLREQNATPEQLKAVGIDLTEGQTQNTLALQKLDDNLFHFVKSGELKPNQGVIIGDTLGGDARAQTAIFKWLKGKETAGKDVTNGVLREMALQAADAGESSGELLPGQQAGFGAILGDDYLKRNLMEEKAQVMASIKSRIASERSAFSNAAKNQTKLEAVGNVMVDSNKLMADKAAQRLFVLEKKTKSPEINEALKNAAEALAANPKNKNSIIQSAYESITTAADEALASAPQDSPPPQLTFAGHAPDGQATFAGPDGKPLSAQQANLLTKEPGFSLGGGMPGVSQLVQVLEPEIRYASEQLVKGGRALNDTVAKWLWPQTRGPMAGRAAEIVRSAANEGYMRSVPDIAISAPLRDQTEKILAANNGDWKAAYDWLYGAYEKGQTPAGMDPKLQPVLDRIADSYVERREQANLLRTGRGKAPIAELDNYLSHSYVDSPDKIREVLNRTSQTSGQSLTKGTPFTKSRKYLGIMDAINAGLTPKYKNPVDMIMAGLQQYDSYITAETMFANMRDSGMLRYAPKGQAMPAGWAAIPDDFFKVGEYVPAAGGTVERGQWVAPEEAAHVLDKYLSPSALGKTLRATLGPGGAGRVNAFRVGFSAFHAENEIAAAMAQLQGTGLMRAFNGLITGDAREMANGMAIAGRNVSPDKVFTELFHDGDRMIQALLDPGTQGQVYDDAMKAAVTGGLRVKPEQTRQFADTMLGALDEMRHPMRRPGEKISANPPPPITAAAGKVGRFLGGEVSGAQHLTTDWIMNWLVPRVKLGAYRKLLDQEMDHYVTKTGGQLPWVLQRKVMQNVADHVESLFGQMNEDNLMMSKTMKDIMHIGIAYPTWNIGSARLALRAAQGVGRALTFREMDSQQRLAIQFGMGLMTSQAVQNTLLMRMLTGTWPKTIQDLYQPQNGGKDQFGNPTRVAPPGYMRTYISAGKHPVRWAENVQNYYWSAIDAGYKNRDPYTGEQIWDPQAPLDEQMEQFGKYYLRYLEPFSVTNVERTKESGGGLGARTLGALGFTPVPGEFLRTKAENYIIGQVSKNAPDTGLTPQQYEAQQLRRGLTQAIRDRKPLPADQVAKLQKMTPSIRHKITEEAAKEAKLPAIVGDMRRLKLHQVLEAYTLAADNGDMKNQRFAEAVIKDKANRVKPEDWDAELDELNAVDAQRYRTLLMQILTGRKPGTEAAPPAPMS